MKILRLFLVIFCFFSIFNDRAIFDNQKIESEINLEVQTKIVEVNNSSNSSFIHIFNNINFDHLISHFTDYLFNKKSSKNLYTNILIIQPSTGPPKLYL